MFQIHKKPQGDALVKKSVQKILDPKKDIVTRLKHLRLVLENVSDSGEEQTIFEQYYSHIYYVFYENFIIAEANVRQKGAHRAQREDLESMLQIFETILIHLPDMLHDRWHYNSIDHIIKTLLHPGNSFKMRREGVKYFLLWFRALQENAKGETVLLYASIVPGFPTPPTKDDRYRNCTLETLLNPISESHSVGMCSADIACLVPSLAGEKIPSDSTKFFLDAMLEFMVVEACKLQWKDPQTMNKTSLSFLWDMFKKFYLPHIFQDFRFDTSIYQPDLSLPEPREPVNYILNVTETGTIDPCIEVGDGCPMLPARVSTIKWVVVFTSNTLRDENKSKPGRSDIILDGLSRLLQAHMQHQQQIVSSVVGLSDQALHTQTNRLNVPNSSQDQETSHSNASTLTDKAPSLSSLSSLDDKLKSISTVSEEEELVRDILYSTRENVNIVQEVFRQALMLPLTEAKTMRRIVKVYQEWIQEGLTPVFMEETELNDVSENREGKTDSSDDSDGQVNDSRKHSTTSSSSLRNVSYMKGQLNPLLDEAFSTHVQAGRQTTYQLFVTNSAHVFLVEPPNDAHKLIQAQVDVCKRVLNLYRHMVMHITMDNTTWTQLLQVLLHITRIMLQDAETPASIRVTTVAGRLAGPVFQTLIVSWIKANLFVHVSRELWDELVDVLSSLMHWKDLIIEWAKNMDTMTRVLARHVYGLELSDLPLDRLTEQKQMKNRKGPRERVAKPAEKSFSKGWSREDSRPKLDLRMRSRTALGVEPDSKTPTLTICDHKTVTNENLLERRGRSVTVLGLEPAPETDPALRNLSPSREQAEHSGHFPLKRGRSDTSDLSSSPPPGFLNVIGVKSDSLQRSSSTSDIASEKIIEIFPEDTQTQYGLLGRQRCNSGPGYRDLNEETVHGLRICSIDNDGVTSLSSVEDAFNDMFDELAQQRLSTVNPKIEGFSAQPDVVSVKSQDSGSIDPNWNPWAESNGGTRGSLVGDLEDSSQEKFFPAHEEKDAVGYSDLKDDDETEWGSCLEDSNYGEGDENEDLSSEDSDSSSTSSDYDFSSTTGTLTLSGSCSMTPNLDIPHSSSATNKQLDILSLLASTRPTTLSFAAASSTSQSMIQTDPTPPRVSWDFCPTSKLHKSYSNPSTPPPIIDKPPAHPLRRTKSYLSHPSSRRQMIRGVSVPQRVPPRSLPSTSLALAPSHRTFPLTKLSSSRRVVEPVSSTNESFSCPIKISRSMQCFPCFNVDGMLPSQLAELPLTTNRDENVGNELVSMLTKEKNTSSETASPGMNSPPYQTFKHGSRDRYDSTALLIPESRRRSVSQNEYRESIAEVNEATGDSPDADEMLEKSSDDILEVHYNNPQAALLRGESGEVAIMTSGDNKVSAMQQHKTGDSLLEPSEDCSILAGGRRTGWYPDVAVALWRRLLGILGDVNKVEDPVIHQLIFTYLLKFWNVLFKLQENLGITTDNASTPPPPELVPPLRIMAPWAFKAVMSLPDSHKGGCLHAFQLLCNTTIQSHDTRLEPEHLALFYMVLHEGLHSDQDKVNEIVESACPKFFSCCLPASTLLLLDFIYACHSVAASTDLSGPRVEAQTILGSVLCFPNFYYDLPVLNPDSEEPQVLVCSNIKEYVADALLTSAKKEPSAPARCVALSSLGVWLYEELTSPIEENCPTPSPESSESFTADVNLSPVKGRILARHGRVKEAINVLLVSLKFNNRIVASVACSQLHLLTHCVPQLLEYMPEMPSRIIEVMSLTASAILQSSEAKSSESGRRLLVSLLLCICEWCMVVPLSMLIETTLPGSDKRLIRTVFKALQTGALGKPGHSAKHSYSLSDLASKDFDPNLHLDKVLENSNSSSGSLRNSNKLTLPPLPSVSLGTDNVVSLTASTVLSHLTNHLGHFPLAKGPAVLNSLVTEQQDHGLSTDKQLSADLSHYLFNSPNVQFLIYNDRCLLSMVEIPTQSDVPGGGPTAGLPTSPTNVRIIVRDTSGKFCWDSSILYGTPNIKEQTMPVSIIPLSTLDQEISKVIAEHCQSYIACAEAELERKRRVTDTPLPLHDASLDPEVASDKLDQLLQYIGYSSPECQVYPGRPLNIPGSPPKVIEDSKIQEKAVEFLLHQHKSQSANYSANAHHSSCQSRCARPLVYSPPQSPFHQSRLLISQTAFLSKENRRRVTLLKKNERLLRELKNLDSRSCRETHKVAVLYIAPGQEDKLSILSNTAGSEEFENFVSGLGWEVDLKVHSGFRGKLHSDGSTGTTSPYYATSTLEVVFHVSTRFPSTSDDSRNIKLKHLGNDEVHIVWSEHSREYRRGIIPTEFGDVLIIIYPLRHGLFRIQIKKKEEVPYFGPLFDGAIVNARVLPVLVRETAINAGRAKRSQISLYQPFYEERAKYLRQIIDQFRDDSTFEEYAAHLFSPAQIRASSPSSKVAPKRPAPKPSPPLHPLDNSSSSQTTLPLSVSTLAPSPIVGKILPLAAPSPMINANNNNNSSVEAMAHSSGHEVETKNRHRSGDSGGSSHTIPPPIKEHPPVESKDGPRYTPGHQISSTKGPQNPAPSSAPLNLFSTKATSTHLISTPRPKPSLSHHSSISALSFSQTQQQQPPAYATSIPSSTKIHIPVSKMQLSATKSTSNVGTPNTPGKRHPTDHVKSSSASTTEIILIPPPAASRSKSVQHSGSVGVKSHHHSLSVPTSPMTMSAPVQYQNDLK